LDSAFLPLSNPKMFIMFATIREKEPQGLRHPAQAGESGRSRATLTAAYAHA
jgi:hypothetical protein